MSIALRSLDLEKIISTLEKLQRRISERFPTAGIVSVCQELVVIARQASARAVELDRPIWPLRFCVVLVCAVALAFIALLVPEVSAPEGKINLVEFLQGIESGVNDFILCGAGLFFLISWEARIKRKRALLALHELRSVAHIIDMHQLTKDPERVISGAENTGSSPKERLAPLLLGRYLDYCSEMLSLTGKIAAIYAENLNDPVVLAAVNEIESLTNGYSRKIWQKIMILHTGPIRR